MARFSERMDAIRAAAKAVAPEDTYVVLSDNLSHLGNGTFAVSIKAECERCEGEGFVQERGTSVNPMSGVRGWDPQMDFDAACPACDDGEGRSTGSHTVASLLVKWSDDPAEVGARLTERMVKA
jgi:hypothetical protein